MNAVVTRMDVLQNEEDEILVMLVEVYESQKNIEESVVDLSGTFAKTCYFLVIDDTVSGGIVVNLDGAVNPDRELVDEVFLVLRKWIVLIQIDDGFWGIFAKTLSPSGVSSSSTLGKIKRNRSVGYCSNTQHS